MVVDKRTIKQVVAREHKFLAAIPQSSCLIYIYGIDNFYVHISNT